MRHGHSESAREQKIALYKSKQQQQQQQLRKGMLLIQLWHIGHSAKSAGGRLQLNTHTPYVCGFALSDVVVWCTQNAPRWQQFHVAPAMPAL